jgi:hypothetical protein
MWNSQQKKNMYVHINKNEKKNTMTCNKSHTYPFGSVLDNADKFGVGIIVCCDFFQNRWIAGT